MQSTFGGRPLEIDMDRDLPEGTALAVASDGIRSDTIRVPDQMPPAWAAKLVLSVEDFGRLLRFHSENCNRLA